MAADGVTIMGKSEEWVCAENPGHMSAQMETSIEEHSAYSTMKIFT